MSYEELTRLIELRDEAVKLRGIYPARAYVKEEEEHTLFFHTVEKELSGRRIKVETEHVGYEFVAENDVVDKLKELIKERKLNYVL